MARPTVLRDQRLAPAVWLAVSKLRPAPKAGGMSLAVESPWSGLWRLRGRGHRSYHSVQPAPRGRG